MNLERDTAPTGFYDYLPRGTIRRNAYTRKSYTRKTGTKVRGSRVPARFIRDVGAPGKWRSRHMYAPGIGKLKTGLLSSLGYDVNSSVTRRHRAVKRAVAKYGRSSTIKKLNAVAVYTRRTSPAKSKKFKADMKFAQKLKGGASNEELEAFKSEVSHALNDMNETDLAPPELLTKAKGLGLAVTDATTIDELYSAVKDTLSAKK